ncbi:MAG: hypothetical protein ACRDGN_04580 [bacterium]
MKRLTILAVSAAVVLLTAPAFAQPASLPGSASAPGSGFYFYHRRPTPIGEILRNPLAHKVVTIRGRVIMSRGAWFVLDDRTGRIRVDAKPLWRRPLVVREGETVTVTGEVVFGPPWQRTPAVAVAAYMIQRSDDLMLRLRPYLKPQLVRY